jgi:hypothetical protein
MRRFLKKAAPPAALFLALALCIHCAGTILRPKRCESGANFGRFICEEKNTMDAVFFGSSLVYCDVMPEVIARESGKRAYVLAGPEQTIPATYWYVREMYETQSPSLVFVEVTGAYFPRYTNYSKVNVGYMPWGINRLYATFETAENAEWTGLLFPLWNYHDRWDELTREDLLPYGRDPRGGYTYLDAKAADAAVKERPVEEDAENYRRNLLYLEKIRDLCEEKGSSVVFYITPSYFRLAGRYVDALREDLAAFGAALHDLNGRFDELGIDPASDFYDTLHFNVYGAEKFSAFLAAEYFS